MAKKRSKPATVAARGPAPATQTDRRLRLAVSAVLAILTIAVYTPVWQFAFVALDDPQYVYANKNLAAGLTAESIAWAVTTGHEANWHPLTWLSHALDISLFGMNSGWHHTVNLLLHLVNTLLLFAVLRRLTASMWPSAFVAALFAVHPLHVESVAWVAERKDLLSALFFFLTLGAYERYVRAPTSRRYLLVAVLLAVGLTAKAMLVTVPMVLLLLDYWPLGRTGKSFGALVVEKLPLVAIVAASSVVTFLVQRAGGAVKSLESFPLGLRVQNAVVSYLDYLRVSAWPVDLGVFYPFPSSVPAATIAVSAAVVLVLSIGAIVLARRVPAVIVGWLIYLGMLVPVIGLVQIGGQARADRYMYLPLIGVAIAVAWGSLAIAKSMTARRALAAIAAVAVVGYAVAANAQVQHWRDTVTLWSHTARATDKVNNFGVYFGLAEYLRATGRASDSIPVYEKSIAKNGTYFEARMGLARSLVETRQEPRAIEELRAAVALQPDSVETRMSLALLLGEANRMPEAIAQFGEAVRLKPDDPSIRHDFARALAQNKQFADAAREWEEVVRRDPKMTDARLNLAIALLQLNRIEDAARHLREVLKQDPGNEAAKRMLAAIGR